MLWFFPHAFEYRNDAYYFCNGDGWAYRLNSGEAGAIAFRLTAVLVMGAAGFFGWALFSFYVTVELHSHSAGSSWLLDSSVVYPVVFSYWALAWLFSGATWLGLSWRLADRERERAVNPPRLSGTVKATRPLHTLALALLACAFVGQGFGDACVGFRGTGTCDFIKITPS